jgi:hypothetical protein
VPRRLFQGQLLTEEEALQAAQAWGTQRGLDVAGVKRYMSALGAMGGE